MKPQGAAKRLPMRITLLLWLVFYLTCWQVVRLIGGIAWSKALNTYEASPGALYISASGAAWAGAGIFLLWSMWRGKRWTRTAFLAVTASYATWFWFDRLFVQIRPRANWPFAAAVTVVILLFTLVVILNPRYRNFFEREHYDRES